MLGACNTCVRLQSRVTSSGTTVDGLVFIVIFIFLFVFIVVFVCFLFVIIPCYVLFYYILYIYYYYLFFPCGMGSGIKIGFSTGDGGMGLEALIKKNTGMRTKVWLWLFGTGKTIWKKHINNLRIGKCTKRSQTTQMS